MSGRSGVTVLAAAAGDYHSLVRETAGRVWALTQLTAGSTHSLAVDSSNQVWRWGGTLTASLGIRVAPARFPAW